MYNWRKMNSAQRAEALELRQRMSVPWHGPPHRIGDRPLYHVTAACYEHQPVIGQSPERMAVFEQLLLETLGTNSEQVMAWCVLPNHYHALVRTEAVLGVLADLGRLHGRASFNWNGEEERRGRQCWHRAAERTMRSERHQWATVNYIHHNPVHHGYVARWQDWPYSSAAQFVESVGRERAEEIWREYPVLDYGKGWDDAEL
jgi:putative transposase